MVYTTLSILSMHAGMHDSVLLNFWVSPKVVYGKVACTSLTFTCRAISAEVVAFFTLTTFTFLREAFLTTAVSSIAVTH